MLQGEQQKTMGTWPVFLTAISTILGAILFLRFGYSIAHVGLINTLIIILIGHLVTIPARMLALEATHGELGLDTTSIVCALLHDTVTTLCLLISLVE